MTFVMLGPIKISANVITLMGKQFYYSISQNVVTLLGRKLMLLMDVKLHYQALNTLSGVFVTLLDNGQY